VRSKQVFNDILPWIIAVMAPGKPVQLDGQYINPGPLNPTAAIADAYIDFDPSTLKTKFADN
jgi:hypothetical protein